MTNIIIKSEPGFSPAIDAEIVGTANDYIHNDPNGKQMRLDAHGVVKDKGTGGIVYLNYTGIVNITPELGMILGGDPNAKSTEFGDSFIEMRFETGDEKLKDLELGVFLALEICRLLDIQDIKNLRLVSKYHNDLAIPFLFHQLQLVFHAESFDRLLAVAQHPVISKEIKSLYYEPALIEDHESRDRWERHVQSPMAIRSARKDPKYTAEQLEVGYVQYEEQLQGQNRLKKTHYGNSQFRQAIPNMPNLQHLVMAISNYRKPASNYFTKTFEPGLHKPFTDATNGHAPGLPQLRAFYLAAFQHGLKLRSFVCEGISRQFLNSSKEDLDKLADVLSEATDIVLRLNTVIGHRRPVAQWGEHRRDLKNRRIADLLRQIEHLQSLELHLEAANATLKEGSAWPPGSRTVENVL
ncbi:MAG: hypothetical protein LQ352_005302 [Teloschistes flavicans]|nr:MAG: hypothetical protein LQ352_005302 [Teloschistes flavicans]